MTDPTETSHENSLDAVFGIFLGCLGGGAFYGALIFLALAVGAI